MTKNFKLVLALLLAAMMIASMVPAFAATVTIKDKATSNHEYKVYQIFTGTLTEETNPETGVKTQTLSDIKYGSNYTGKGVEGVTAATEAQAIVGSSATDKAREFAVSLTDKDTSNGEISGTPVATLNAANNFTQTVDKDGYYLIVDTLFGTTTLAQGDMLSRYIVQIAGNTEIAPKKSTVEEDKKIKTDTHDANPSVAGTGEDISTDKTADDVSIGEDVTYIIDATIPLAAADFDKYFFIVNDTLSEGLTLKRDSFKIYTLNGETETTFTDYTLFLEAKEGDSTTPVATTGKTFELAVKNAKNHAGETIYIEYTATLNEHANLGEVPNTNTTNITYSNNPEQKYEGEDNNNDGKPDDMTKTIYGTSPDRVDKTFTSSIQLKKTDEDGEILTGAKFRLTGTSVKTVVVTTDVYTANDTTGTFYKLADGSFTTTAPTTDVTYVSKGTGKTDGGYVKEGSSYRVATYDELNDTTTEIFKKVDPTISQYDATSPEQKYVKEKKSETQTKTDEVNVEAFVDSTGYVRFDGLGSGTYTISEIVVPAGYNKIDDFTVTLTFDNTDGDRDSTNDNTDTDSLVWSATSSITTGAITEKDTDIDTDTDPDTFEITVVNKTGVELPSTGGIGTTIFYVAGSIMVLAAAILLITKRRMGAND